MKREDLKSADFDYDLPEERIAKYPLSNRNHSKLLTYKNGEVGEDVFLNLKEHLPKNSILVFNDTKVLAARLYFRKSTGAKVEIFCLEPHQTTVEQSLNSTKSCRWNCLVGNLKRFKATDVLEMKIADTQLQARIVEKRQNDVVIQFDWLGEIPFSNILEEAGEIPLPPYLNRATEEADSQNYQTIYAKTKGAVAAPTAGLHFVESQLQDLQKSGFELEQLTLYVGAGTFRPVKTEQLVAHEMHQERIVISKNTLAHLAHQKGKIISVGTTTLRSLESLYWLAVKRKTRNSPEEHFVSQEDAYELPSEMSWQQACEFLLDELEENGRQSIDFYSALFIMPGYQWKAIDGLITNFHQPKSTLLTLVAAWIGGDWQKVYNYALKNDFRFLSYGDSSLLL